PARLALVAALDDWANVEGKLEQLERLLAIARQVDPDPWRDRFRDIRAWNDETKMDALAKEVGIEQQSVQVLIALAFRLPEKEGKRSDLLRQVVRHYQRDFLL